MPSLARRRRQPPDLAAMARHAEDAAALMKSLAHAGRLQVVCRLVEGEASVSELQALTGLSMSALSQHLALLRESGIVTTRRQAQTIFYSLCDGPAHAVIEALHDAFCPT